MPKYYTRPARSSTASKIRESKPPDHPSYGLTKRIRVTNALALDDGKPPPYTTNAIAIAAILGSRMKLYKADDDRMPDAVKLVCKTTPGIRENFTYLTWVSQAKLAAECDLAVNTFKRHIRLLLEGDTQLIDRYKVYWNKDKTPGYLTVALTDPEKYRAARDKAMAANAAERSSHEHEAVVRLQQRMLKGEISKAVYEAAIAEAGAVNKRRPGSVSS